MRIKIQEHHGETISTYVTLNDVTSTVFYYGPPGKEERHAETDPAKRSANLNLSRAIVKTNHDEHIRKLGIHLASTCAWVT